MKIFLWILQIALAIHTGIGAIWKISNSEQTVQSLNTIPHWLWIKIIILEFLGVIILLLPVIIKKTGSWVPYVALFLVIEMIFFTIVNASNTGNTDFNQIIYWMIVAVISGFFAYARFKIKPL